MNIRIFVIAGLISIFPLAYSAAAQSIGLNEAQEIISSCIKREQGNHRYGSVCINQFTDKCLEDEKNFTTVAMRQCINFEHQVWDKVLNNDYQELMNSLDSKENKDKLRQAQRNWNKFVRSFCPLAYEFNGGTLHLLTGDQCMMEMTARQVIELKKLIGQPM